MKSKYDEEKEAIKSTLKNKAKESLAKEIKKHRLKTKGVHLRIKYNV